MTLAWHFLKFTVDLVWFAQCLYVLKLLHRNARCSTCKCLLDVNIHFLGGWSRWPLKVPSNSKHSLIYICNFSLKLPQIVKYSFAVLSEKTPKSYLWKCTSQRTKYSGWPVFCYYWIMKLNANTSRTNTRKVTVHCGTKYKRAQSAHSKTEAILN